MKKIMNKLAVILTGFQLLIMTANISYAQGENELKTMDTTAGKPAMIMVSGSPWEIVELTMVNPYNSVIKQKYQLSEHGIMQYWYAATTVAGKYLVSYKGQEVPFYVSASFPNPAKSSLELSDYTSFLGEEIDGLITLKDSFGNLIVGKKLSIEA